MQSVDLLWNAYWNSIIKHLFVKSIAYRYTVYFSKKEIKSETELASFIFCPIFFLVNIRLWCVAYLKSFIPIWEKIQAFWKVKNNQITRPKLCLMKIEQQTTTSEQHTISDSLSLNALRCFNFTEWLPDSISKTGHFQLQTN